MKSFLWSFEQLLYKSFPPSHVQWWPTSQPLLLLKAPWKSSSWPTWLGESWNSYNSTFTSCLGFSMLNGVCVTLGVPKTWTPSSSSSSCQYTPYFLESTQAFPRIMFGSNLFRSDLFWVKNVIRKTIKVPTTIR